VGYLGVKSKSVTKGYWNNSYLTEKNRLRGFWLTGDLAYKDEEGLHYHVDRISDKIETDSGVFYSCQSEEWILKNIPCIFDLSFVSSKDSEEQTEIVAWVELQKEEQDMNLDLLKQEINHWLSQKKWPLVSKVHAQSAHEYVGVTGKKLKRKIRLEA
jgi:acyl-CoA synthetase (AMP-forming)/AMP-acid ligase II